MGWENVPSRSILENGSIGFTTCSKKFHAAYIVHGSVSG